jgi:hypothetical protein
MSNLAIQLIKKPDSNYPKVNDVFKAINTPTPNAE